MIRLIFRLSGYLLIAIGFASLVVDGTASVATATLKMTSFSQLFTAALPDGLARLELWTTRQLHPLVWDPVLTGLFRQPAFMVLMVAGLFLVVLARRRRTEIGFMPTQ